MSDFLPPVILKLSADISEYIAKLAEADAALQAFVHNSGGNASTGLGTEGEDAGRRFSDGVDDGVKDVGERVARDVSGRLRDERGRFVAEGERAGEDAGGGILKGIGKAIKGIGGAIGSTFGVAWKSLLITAIPAAIGAAAQLVTALAPAVGIIGLIPAGALAGATALGTLKVAMSGVGQALKDSGNLQKFNQDLKGLAPSAQAAVKAMVGLKPQLDSIKQAVQGNFFAGLAGDIKTVGGTYLPILRTELGYTATGFNEVIGSIAQMAKAPAATQAFAGAMHNVMLAITGIADAIPGFAAGFAKIAAVGAGFLPGLTSGFAALGDRFNAFISRVSQSGQLQSFIQGGLDALHALMPLLSNLGSIVSSLFQAMGASGGQALGVIGDLVGVVAQFLKSAQGMSALTSLFSMLGQIANALGGALGQTLTALGPAIGAVMAGLQPIISLLTGQFLPIVTQLATTLASALVPIINALAPALLSVLQALMPLIAMLGGALGQVITALAPIIAQLATVIGQILTQALQALMPIFSSLLPVLVQLVQALLPALVPLIQLVGQVFALLMPILQPLIKLLVDILVPVLKLLTPVIQLLAPIIGLLATAITAVLGPVASFIGWLVKGLDSAKMWKAVGSWFVGIWHDIEGFFKGVGSAIAKFFTQTIPHAFEAALHWFEALPGKIGAALEALPGLLMRLATTAMHNFFYAIGYGIGLAIKIFIELPGKIWALLTMLWDGAVQLVSTGITNMISFIQQLPGRAAAFFTQLWHDSVNFVTNLVTDVVNWVSQLPGRVASFISDTWSQAKTLFNDGVNAVVSFAQSLPGKVGSAVSSLWSSIKGAIGDLFSNGVQLGEDLLNGLISGIGNMVQSAIGAVKSAIGDVVKGAKNALGIGSPSKVFAELGMFSVSGYVQGITKNAGKAADAVAAMLAPPSVGMPSFAVAGLASSPGGGRALMTPVGVGAPSGNVMVQANLYLDGKQIHTALIGPAQRYKARTGTTGLT